MDEHYKVVTATDIENLEKQVNKRIADGYEPLGSLLFIPGAAAARICQAMVKKE